MLKRHATLIGLSALLLVLVSCSRVQDMQGQFKDLLTVRGDLAKTLGQNDIGVTVTNGAFGAFLTVRIVNSPLNELPAVGKNAKAFEIARQAYRGYPARSALRSVTVVFGIHRSYLGIFSYDGSAGAFRFNASQLADVAPAPSTVSLTGNDAGPFPKFS